MLTGSCGWGPGGEVCDAAGAGNGTWPAHIVRFHQYHTLQSLETYVRSILPDADFWEWKPRRNPATRFPSDFALLRIHPEHTQRLLRSLEADPAVRDAHPDRTIRSLSATDLLTRAPEAPASGPAHGHAHPDTEAVSKPSGRLITRWSVDDTHATASRDAVEAAHLQSSAQVLQERFQAYQATIKHLQEHGHDIQAHNTSAEWQECVHSTGGLESEQATRAGDQDAAAAVPSTCAYGKGLRQLQGWGPLLGDAGEGEGAWEQEAARRRTLASMTQVTTALGAPSLWREGFNGRNIKVGVFDTGIREHHPHMKNLRERSNWTHENTLADELGHGTFVAGVIGGSHQDCPGFAPEVDLHTFKVFTNDQVSFTSWFLDAFNYAIATDMDIVNLSIGGPDFLDAPFVDKVLEISANGIIMVSAIGNDGPLHGTLNNPADQLDIIGVGGLDYADHIALFSSRGMSTWELPTGFGVSKPDVMAYGKDVRGSKIEGGCRSLSGTSVASPVVTGAVALLASTLPDAKRKQILNPASMKQALVEGAAQLAGLNLYEQGAGKINLRNSKQILQSYIPRASLLPSVFDLTQCPYMWPYCLQPLYAHAQPIIFNATVLNGMGVWGRLAERPTWVPANEGGRMLNVIFTYSDVLWPWSGHLTIHITVKDDAEAFSGDASGSIRFTVESPPQVGEKAPRTSNVVASVHAAITPTPPRRRRFLWDQFHSVKYPPAYLPRDNLEIRSDILDWHGDHLLTNYHTLYTFLRGKGVFVEILASPITCFDAKQYGALVIADSEDEFYSSEISKLAQDVTFEGLGLLVFPEWYSLESMARMRFFDDNTRSWWTPATGGSNIPALNALLEPFELSFGDHVLHGPITVGSAHKIVYASGTHVIQAPTSTHLLSSDLQTRPPNGQAASGKSDLYHVLAMVQHGLGRIATLGDASCVDANHASSNCHGLVLDMFEWATGAELPVWASAMTQLEARLVAEPGAMPVRPEPNLLTAASFVLNHPQKCYLNSAVGFAEQLQEPTEPTWKGVPPRVPPIVEGHIEIGNPSRIHQSIPTAQAPSASYMGSVAMFGLVSMVVLMIAWLWIAKVARKGHASLKARDRPRSGKSSPAMPRVGSRGTLTRALRQE